ncbi:MAG: hypothetical protein GKS07_09060 [Nitrosopumilus sp.]|nr:MAG: hypothetical protein GKS07_09060 [Nitrosopumilus sp.]
MKTRITVLVVLRKKWMAIKYLVSTLNEQKRNDLDAKNCHLFKCIVSVDFGIMIVGAKTVIWIHQKGNP